MFQTKYVVCGSCFCRQVVDSGTSDENGVNLSQSCHDRAHTDSVPNTRVRFSLFMLHFYIEIN